MLTISSRIYLSIQAGFCARVEFFRFFNRFNILSKTTYPDYRGSDRDGCREIVKYIRSSNKIAELTG